MNALENITRQFDNTVNTGMNFVDQNQYISVALGLFLILYAGLAAPKLPESIAKLFDNMLFKFIVLFLVAYGARKNPTVAIIAVVGLLVSIQALNRIKLNKALMTIFGTEGMETVSAEAEASGGCTQTGQYRNAFYPQYVNMKPDAYLARYTNDNVSGFDPSASYA